MTIPNGNEQLRRDFEAFSIGRLEVLRVKLEFFLEDIKSIPAPAIPERFAGIVIDAETLLSDVRAVLQRPVIARVFDDHLATPAKEAAAEPVVTDAMVEAAKEAMVWEGCSISEEEQGEVMRDVLTRALMTKKTDTL